MYQGGSGEFQKNNIGVHSARGNHKTYRPFGRIEK
jgi:hypothetical protein